MELNERQYEDVGRWLDGEAVDLTAEQLAAAAEIRLGQAAVGRAMAVPAPRAAMDKARRRALAEMARPRRWALKVRWAADVAAVAAVVVLAVAYWPQTKAPQAVGTAVLSEPNNPSAAMWTETLEGPSDLKMALLSRGVDELEGDVELLRPPMVEETTIDDLQRQVDDIWLDASVPGLLRG